MPRYKYVGEVEIPNLAGIGKVLPGDVFLLNVNQAAAIEKNDPESFKLVPDETPLVSLGVKEGSDGSTDTVSSDESSGADQPTAGTPPTKADKKARVQSRA